MTFSDFVDHWRDRPPLVFRWILTHLDPSIVNSPTKSFPAQNKNWAQSSTWASPKTITSFARIRSDQSTLASNGANVRCPLPFDLISSGVFLPSSLSEVSSICLRISLCLRCGDKSGTFSGLCTDWGASKCRFSSRDEVSDSLPSPGSRAIRCVATGACNGGRAVPPRGSSVTTQAEKDDVSAALLQDLTTQRTAALRAALSVRPEIALIAITDNLVAQIVLRKTSIFLAIPGSIVWQVFRAARPSSDTLSASRASTDLCWLKLSPWGQKKPMPWRRLRESS